MGAIARYVICIENGFSHVPVGEKAVEYLRTYSQPMAFPPAPAPAPPTCSRDGALPQESIQPCRLLCAPLSLVAVRPFAQLTHASDGAACRPPRRESACDSLGLPCQNPPPMGEGFFRLGRPSRCSNQRHLRFFPGRVSKSKHRATLRHVCSCGGTSSQVAGQAGHFSHKCKRLIQCCAALLHLPEGK